jgi:hypothetical protein
VGVAEGEPVATMGPGVGVDVGYADGDCQSNSQAVTAHRDQQAFVRRLTAVGEAVGAAVGEAVGDEVGACGHDG